MIPVVFVIGILNLMLGFALAVLLERQITIPVPLLRAHREPGSEGVPLEIPTTAASLEEVRDELPARWLDLLQSMDRQFSTFVEASVEILKLEVDTYREDMLDIEDLVRSAIAKKNPDAVRDALQELVALNEEWVTTECEALTVLANQRHQLGEYSVIGNRLEGILLDQSSLIDSRCKSIVKLDLKQDQAAADSIISDVGDLVRMAHELRDTIRDATLMIICNEHQLESSDRRQHFDALTGLQNRMGVELLFKKWWSQDVKRTRPVSVALVDIDQFGAVNNLLGTRAGDRLLHVISRYLGQLTAKDNGLHRVFRFGGQRFFLFFGETNSRGAVTIVERVRQTMEATKFEYKGGQHSLTIRAGLTDVRRDDETVTLFARLEELVANAKRVGRNRTCLDDATGMGVIQPEPMPIKSCVVKVE